jgi:beta-phosphoglucomutase
MKIFLSHAIGDQRLAERLKQLMEDVSIGLIEPWLSSSPEGLKPGDVLWDKVHEQLRCANRIITLLTPTSYNRPWLLYESGFVAGNQGGVQVIPVLFGIQASQLPLPLSSYVMYSGDNPEDLTRLLLQLVSEVAPHPKKELVSNLVLGFISELDRLIASGPTDVILDNMLNEKQLYEDLGIRFIDKLKASEIFHRKLSDPATKKITIVSYTNEVEAGAITHYRVVGKKDIEVLKRSIWIDLAEQQVCNLTRLASGVKVRPWSKRTVSLNASKVIADEFAESQDVRVSQLFYPYPPTKRAYIFDSTEAIVGTYEHQQDLLSGGGSLYKGMGSTPSVWISNQSMIGRFLLEEMLLHINFLRMHSHTWEKELEVIEQNRSFPNEINSPCFNPEAVFLDLDGVLYDSLSQYVEAWTQGFALVGINVPVIEIYREEGRKGHATVESIRDRLGLRALLKSEIDSILTKRSEVLLSLGRPPIQRGAKELVRAIAKSKLPIWVVTGSSRENLAEQVAEDFAGLIAADNVITGNHVRVGKPDPEPYLLAVEDAHVSPHRAIVIENGPLGIRSASQAGNFCIAVNTGCLEDRELLDAGARVVFSSCEFVANCWTEILKILST